MNDSSSTSLSPADCAALGHMPSATAINQEWDGCGCCGWCQIVMACSCGWQVEIGATMSRGRIDNSSYGEAWQAWRTNHGEIMSTPRPDWFTIAE